MGEEPKRMWIDLIPPDCPEKGDVWIRYGQLRVWDGNWDPLWLPPEEVMPPGYPAAGWRKGKKRRNRNKPAAEEEAGKKE